MIAARQIAFGRGAGKRKPYDAEIEYLESTGTQYLDTGIKLASTTKAVVDTAFTSGSVLGVIFPSNYSTWFCFTSGTTSTVRYYYGSVSNYDYTIDKTMRHVYGISKDFEIDGSVVYTSSNTLTAGLLNLYAFGRVNNGNPNDLLKGKIFSLKIYDNDILVRDFIPVRKGNVGYMYDRVSGQLFGNSGTGEFVLGPDLIDYTAKDYVQDGLVAMWDGIENAGWGVHDPSATRLYNLITQQEDDCSAIFVATDNALEVVTVGAVVRKNSYTAKFTKANNNNFWTVNALFYNIMPATAIYGNAFAFAMEYQTIGYSIHNSNIATTNVGGWKAIQGVAADIPRSITLTRNGNNYVLYAGDGSQKIDFVAEVTFTEGFRFNCPAGGKMYGFRFYDRALTAEEVAHNYSIDKVRFGL